MLSTFTSGQILQKAQSTILQLRVALEACADLESWAAGISQADLVTAGFTSADASAVLSALADANGLAQIYKTGTDPRNPGAGYVYANSQNVVIGPS